MKTFVIFAILLASSLTISESYAYLETAIDVCETLYNRPNAPSPSYDPEKYQECVEQAESDQWGIDNRLWIFSGFILAIIVIVFVISAVKSSSHVRTTQEQPSPGGTSDKTSSKTSGELSKCSRCAEQGFTKCLCKICWICGRKYATIDTLMNHFSRWHPSRNIFGI